MRLRSACARRGILLCLLACPADFQLCAHAPPHYRASAATPSPALAPQTYSPGQDSSRTRGEDARRQARQAAPLPAHVRTDSTHDDTARDKPDGHPSPRSLAFAGTPIKVQLGLPIGLR
ncbi:hypothetical protein EDB84DRAFT_1473389 [Lactarius hengduanensis]|nr:hypothetical protein EDB84DRAFT_1473389 [Lactarius hengduanensis]